MIYIDVDTAVEVPVNVVPLTDDTDFKTRETAVAYNASGMDLVWNFVTPNGTITQTAVTPTTSGDYDWAHVGDGMYKIEIPASGGASINNDTEGVGYFSGVCDGVLPWRGPDIVFRAAGLNDALIESAYSTTRGLAGTALPAAAADAAGGLPISDAGGLDLDGRLDAAVSSRSSHSAADVWTSGTRTLTAFSFSVDLNADQSGVTIGTVTTNTDMRGTDSAFLAASAPTNFSALLINVSGHVTRVTTVDTTTANSDMRGTDGANTTTPPTAAAVADAVWDELQSGHTTAGSFGKYLDTEVSGVSGGSAADVYEIKGEVGRTSSGTYYYVYWLEKNGQMLTSGLSAAGVDAYGNNGDTDLGFTTTPTVAGTGRIVGSGTLGTAITDNQPAVFEATVTYDSVAYTGQLSVVAVA